MHKRAMHTDTAAVRSPAHRLATFIMAAKNVMHMRKKPIELNININDETWKCIVCQGRPDLFGANRWLAI